MTIRVLITGGMGFIGRSVVNKLLKRDVEEIVILDNLLPKVHGANNKPYNFKDPKIRFVYGDITERQTVEPLLLSVDHIIHFAAETGTGESMYLIEHYSKINIAGTALILDVLTNQKNKVKKLLVASSRAIYGEGKYSCTEHGIVYPETRCPEEIRKGEFDLKCPYCNRVAVTMATSEDSTIHPVSFYGITKQVQESIIMNLCPNIGISPISLRYQNVYGPGQSLNNPYTGVLSVFSNRIRQGKNIEIFEDGMESRDFVYIDDVADATVEALFHDEASSNIFNVGTGVPINILHVANTLKSLFTKDIEIKINGKYRAGDIRHNYADINKIKRVLGFEPKVTFEQGLSKLVKWVCQQEVDEDLYEESLEEMKQKSLYK